jgi:hypothetical protein
MITGGMDLADDFKRSTSFATYLTNSTPGRADGDAPRAASPINPRPVEYACSDHRKAGFHSLFVSPMLVRARTGERPTLAKARGVKLGREPKLTEQQKRGDPPARPRRWPHVRHFHSYNVSTARRDSANRTPAG